jgi:uncharacterized membrane protein
MTLLQIQQVYVVYDLGEGVGANFVYAEDDDVVVLFLNDEVDISEIYTLAILFLRKFKGVFRDATIFFVANTIFYGVDKKRMQRFVLALLAYLVLDGIWLSLNSFYPTTLEVTTPRLVVGGGIAWMALAAGQALLPTASTWKDAITMGGLFGAVVYAVYNGTEFATRSDWTVGIACMDWLWGTFTGILVALLLWFAKLQK